MDEKVITGIGSGRRKYVLHYDSQSAIYLNKNASFHLRSKHIDIRYHQIHETLEVKSFQIEKIYTNKNRLEMMSKPLSLQKLEPCRKKAGLVEPQIVGNGEICWVFPHIWIMALIVGSLSPLKERL